MTLPEAKRILTAHRAEHDPAEGAVAEALALVRSDPALREWFQKHTNFHQAVRESFRQVPVPPIPAGLVQRMHTRARHPVGPVRPAWRQPAWFAAAACLAFLIGLALFWHPRSQEGSFATFRSRMVRSVLRQYTMDIVTNDMTSIRRFLATHGAPADYVLPPGLDSLPAAGAGVLSWQSNRVSMVCLDSPDQGTLFLFVVDQSTVSVPPSDRPEFVQVSKLMTASWTRDGKSYVLAGSAGRQGLQKRL